MNSHKGPLSHIGQSISKAPPGDRLSGPVRMECYSGHEGQPPCSSLLGRNTTQAECCCTQGTSWGDTCALCPTEDSGTAPSGPTSPQGQLWRVSQRRGQSPPLSELGCLLQWNSARSALVVKATSLWKEPGCLDRPRTQVTSLYILLPNSTHLSGPAWSSRRSQGAPHCLRSPRSGASFLS